MNKKYGFTLLELVIVIIICGVLAALALPRFFNMVERARSVEARVAFAAIRSAVERYSIMHPDPAYLYPQSGPYSLCGASLGKLDIEDPSASPNAHFTYSLTCVVPGVENSLEIRAIRNTRDNGDGTSSITYYLDEVGYDPGFVEGTGVFKKI